MAAPHSTKAAGHSATGTADARGVRGARAAAPTATEGVVLAQQNPAVIDAGVFHNDVIAIGKKGLLLLHQHALQQQAQVLGDCNASLGSIPLQVVEGGQ